jgi:hypothetical protein
VAQHVLVPTLEELGHRERGVGQRNPVIDVALWFLHFPDDLAAGLRTDRLS